MSLALEVEDLRSGYGETTILHDVSFRVAPGTTYALVGKNGAGKTTLVKTVLGVLGTMSGRVKLFEEDITGRPTHKIAGAVGYAPQESAIFPDLSVEENLRLGAIRLKKDEFEQRRDRVCSLFPVLSTRMRQPAGTLSGGEQKMLLVARALLPAPRVVFLDEVTEGLQPSVIDRIQQALVEEQAASGLTLVIVEQNINFILRLSGHFGLMARGEITGTGAMGHPGAKEAIEAHLAI